MDQLRMSQVRHLSVLRTLASNQELASAMVAVSTSLRTQPIAVHVVQVAREALAVLRQCALAPLPRPIFVVILASI